MLNADRLDFDGRLDFSRLEPVAELTRHAASDPARPDEILERLAGQAIVINKEMPISADLIAAFPPSVKLICEAGTGFNNIALEAASKRGIAVANLPTYATEAMAHIAITMVMALSCSLAPQMRYLARYDRAHVERCHLGGMAHFELTDCTLGLVGGLGTIGLRVAAMAQALGMRVIASSRTCPTGMHESGVEVVPLDDLLGRSDFVSIHCPLNAETRGYIDASKLALMKPSAYLVNTARGAIVDEDALVDALRSRRIAGAALDVFGEGAAPPPPPPNDSPLYSLPDEGVHLILTPHIGWQRAESRQRVLDILAENIAAFGEGRRHNVVN